MNRNRFILLVLVVLYGTFVVCDRTCRHIDSCSCKFTDNGKVVSLHNIDFGSPPPARFTGISQASSSFKFDYNPCTPFAKLDGCKNQLVCQYDTKDSFSIADPISLIIPAVKNNQVVFKYTGEPTTPDNTVRGAEITLACDKTVDLPKMSNPIEDQQDPKHPIFKFTITTKCACEGVCSANDSPADAKVLSIGSILCIVLLVLVVVYLIGGILFMKFYKKNEGSEVIPNRDFWADLPSKVKEGCKFTYSKVKRNKDGYEAI